MLVFFLVATLAPFVAFLSGDLIRNRQTSIVGESGRAAKIAVTSAAAAARAIAALAVGAGVLLFAGWLVLKLLAGVVAAIF